MRTEEIAISGGIVRQQMKYDRFLAKRTVTNPSRGPYHFRAPSKILWRTIRGCAPLRCAALRRRRRSGCARAAAGMGNPKTATECSLLALRSMIPHKTKRGQAALERFKAYEGVPPPYDVVKRAVVPDALKVLRLQHGHRYCQLGALASSIGWKHREAVEALEAKRKVKSAAYYEAKKKLRALRAKAEASVQ